MKCISVSFRYVKSLMCLFLILLIGMYGSLYKFKANADTDIINQIICSFKGDIKEYGITAAFSCTNSTSSFINNLMDDFKCKNAKNIKTFKNDHMCRIEFENGYERGYFEIADIKNNTGLMTINIISTDKKSNIKCLKSKFESILKKQKCKIKYFEYIKARIPDNKNLPEESAEIINNLKESQGTNIHAENISNGCSITAYMKKYTPVMVNGRPVDFNIAITHYDTGKYIIIGTPIINETY